MQQMQKNELVTLLWLKYDLLLYVKGILGGPVGWWISGGWFWCWLLGGCVVFVVVWSVCLSSGRSVGWSVCLALFLSFVRLALFWVV